MSSTIGKDSLMCRVKARVVRGSIGSERVAYIKTVKGYQPEVVVSASFSAMKSMKRA